MKRRKLNVSKLLTLGLLLSYSANIAANTTSETTSIQQNSSYKVTGVVSDTNGEPIIGASVVEKGTSNGTITDLDGKFTIEVNAGATLNISYIGYKNQEVKVDRNGLSLKLTLKEDTETLDEVVVVGYGTVRKADLAGSVAVMDNKSFKDQPVTRISEALQGRVSGVQVENSGVPGGDIRIRVRGANSVNLSNEPLYVVDGIVREGGLSGLNTDDIKSIQVLKDASSTAIYGSRGANGVVLVTTKTGVAGQTQITFDATLGVSNVYKHYDMLSPYEYAEAYNFWYPGNGYSAEEMDALKTGKKGINWYQKDSNGSFILSECHPMFRTLLYGGGSDGSAMNDYNDREYTMNNGICSQTLYMVSYSEVLLWYAEAQARSGSVNEEAKQCLQKVLDRAYGAGVDDANNYASDPTTFANKCWKEHGYEVAGYYPALVVRANDQLRMDDLKNAFATRQANTPIEVAEGISLKEGVEMSGNWDESRNYATIPSFDADLNENLK